MNIEFLEPVLISEARDIEKKVQKLINCKSSNLIVKPDRCQGGYISHTFKIVDNSLSHENTIQQINDALQFFKRKLGPSEIILVQPFIPKVDKVIKVYKLGNRLEVCYEEVPEIEELLSNFNDTVDY